MTAALDGPRSEAASGTARQLVVLLHGYGADGDDLIGFAAEWGTLLPDAAFSAPHAPQPCAQSPTGRQWFPLPDPGQPRSSAEVSAALDALDGHIDSELARHALSEISVALVGFSQGAMMALAAGLRRNCAAIVSYSGALIDPPIPRAIRATPPPILLCHGDADPVVPFASLFDAVGRLSGPVRWHVAQGVGHGIDGESLELGGGFLRAAFAGELDEFDPPVPLGG